MKTKEQEFGFHQAGYTKKIVTQKYGDLFLDGIRIMNNLPFSLLQTEKRKLLNQGYTSKRVVIKYHQQ